MQKVVPAVVIHVMPRYGRDAYKLLRDKVTNESDTWSWKNRSKTRLRHLKSSGHIELGGVDGVLVARVFPTRPDQAFHLTEKLVGRLVACFDRDLAGVNVQFVSADSERKSRRA